MSSEAPASAASASRLAWSAVALSLALVAVGQLISLQVDEGSVADKLLYDGSWLIILVAWATVGALIASRQPRNPIGWILLALSLYAGLVSVVESYVDRYLAGGGGSERLAEAAAWMSNWAWIPLVFVPLAFVPIYFPHGRLPSRRWRVVPWCAGLSTAVFALSVSSEAGPLHDYPEIVNPFGVDHIIVDVGAAVGFFASLGAVVAAVASVVARFRNAGGVERQQIKWLAYAGCFAVASVLASGPLSWWSEDVANALVLAAVLGLTVAIGIAILSYGLYDIDLLINRTLVYGGLTVGVVAIYIAVVGVLSNVLHEQAGFWLALVATGLAALLVQPLRSRLQRRVNRIMYGSSGEGHPPAGRWRERLHGAFAPEAAELQRARERLVAAREEERQRLRRDLHDGLGPALAGAALKVEAAENLLRSKPHKAGELLGDARAEIHAAVADVRRLVYDLRPPALDELGLAGALREQAQRLGTGSTPIRFDVEAPEGLNGLPAAVEVAAYRITLEAITNVARHARARACSVRLSANGALELEISDDGRGLPSGYRPGVGIASMRERAEELGGTCQVERVGPRGTRVRARFPLAPA